MTRATLELATSSFACWWHYSLPTGPLLTLHSSWVGRPSVGIFAPRHRVDVWPPRCDLTCNRHQYTTDLQWNGVSNLEPSNSMADTLPLGHRSYKDGRDRPLYQ
ncbi:hypothetical protein AVEN_144084-1 [Araneus ventricosus]|uniref:Uncharacterized protein n=1 Tax=Araneus ventricosus TaxID=182803 RepID=A0A4Y2WH48_ARAVE|nr:hypothetical protein AVEN_144084-1 [Araneus ventricosus]